MQAPEESAQRRGGDRLDGKNRRPSGLRNWAPTADDGVQDVPRGITGYARSLEHKEDRTEH